MKCILLFTLSVLFCACSGETTEVFDVVNNSYAEIKLNFTSTEFAFELEQTIAENESKEVGIYNTVGGRPEPAGPIIFEAVRVTKNNDTMQTNFVYEQNWLVVSTQTDNFPSSYEHRNTLTITDADF